MLDSCSTRKNETIACIETMKESVTVTMGNLVNRPTEKNKNQIQNKLAPYRLSTLTDRVQRSCYRWALTGIVLWICG